MGGIRAASAKLCFPLRRDTDFEQGAVMLVNPLSAWGLMEVVRKGGHKAVVQTAACSALGRMIIRLGRRFSVPVINVVRRPEQVALLRKLGAEHVVNSEDAGFEATLRDLCYRLSATIGFDAIAGEMSGKVLRAQPSGARLLVYGALSPAPAPIDPHSLIFEGKRVESFYLTEWLGCKSLPSLLRISRQVQKPLSSDLKTEFQARMPLHDAANGLRKYLANMTAGKILLMPGK